MEQFVRDIYVYTLCGVALWTIGYMVSSVLGKPKAPRKEIQKALNLSPEDLEALIRFLEYEGSTPPPYRYARLLQQSHRKKDNDEA